MPKKVENKLRARARKMHLKGKKFKAYVYGGLRKMGWKPKKKR